MTEAYPDVEGALRTWLRLQPTLTAHVSTRIFFGVPKPHSEQNYPMVIVTRVGGGGDTSDVPVDLATIQLDVWGRLGASGYGMKAECRTTTNALRAVLEDLEAGNVDVNGTLLHGANVTSDVWLPDPDDDRPRYSLTVSVAAIVA